MASIDHVVLAVSDLDGAGERLRREHGLTSRPGGDHARWGTTNRIVPLGDTYLELLAVRDPGVAARSQLGRALTELVGDGRDRWFAWCVSTSADDLEVIAARLGLTIEPGSRARPDGVELRWRSAGLDDPRRDPGLPFFIAWHGPPDAHPGRAAAGVAGRLTAVELGADGDRLRDWLGDAEGTLPTSIVDAPAGLRAVELTLGDGRRVRVEG